MSTICENSHRQRWVSLVAAIMLITLILVIPSVIRIVNAENINPGVYAVDSRPFGLTYGEWTVKWWQWALSIPKDLNPTADDSGKNCAQGQTDPHVWFLAGTGGGSAVRTCTIPAGKAIFVPFLNGECTYADSPSSKTPSDLRSCSLDSDKGLTTLVASIDGVNLQRVEEYRVTSEPFNVTLADNNILGVRGGPTLGVSDGWWAMINPLSPGNHEIHFAGALGSATVIPTFASTGPRFATEVTYHLTVK